jgi:hypothetical protein
MNARAETSPVLKLKVARAPYPIPLPLALYFQTRLSPFFGGTITQQNSGKPLRKRNMKNRIQKLFLLIGMIVIPVWLLLPSSLHAQMSSNGAQLTGVVKDPAQAQVPGSQVTLTNQQTTVTSTVFRDDEGVYRFLSLSPGTYALRAEAKGFQASVSDGPIASALTQNIFELSNFPVARPALLKPPLAQAKSL